MRGGEHGTAQGAEKSDVNRDINNDKKVRKKEGELSGIGMMMTVIAGSPIEYDEWVTSFQ